MSKVANRGMWVLLAVAVGLLGGAALSLAQSDGYEVSWWTIDAGGASRSGGGGYVLDGTIAQPDAGAVAGGGYVLSGGFWVPTTTQRFEVYLPLLYR